MGNEVLWPEVATVAIVAAQLVVLVAAAIIGRNQVLEARRLREQQIRPVVVIDFDIERGIEVYLEVTNLGNSLAREVTFEITPPLESSIDVPVEKFKMFTEGIATLAPGKRYRTFFDTGFQRVGSELPMTYTAIIRYRDENRRRTFEEEVDLDLAQFIYLETPSRRDVHDVSEHLKEIVGALKKLAWIRGGLLTVSRAEADEIEAERRREIEERRATMEGGRGSHRRLKGMGARLRRLLSSGAGAPASGR
jgi:hypothetical protein